MNNTMRAITALVVCTAAMPVATRADSPVVMREFNSQTEAYGYVWDAVTEEVMRFGIWQMQNEDYSAYYSWESCLGGPCVILASGFAEGLPSSKASISKGQFKLMLEPADLAWSEGTPGTVNVSGSVNGRDESHSVGSYSSVSRGLDGVAIERWRERGSSWQRSADWSGDILGVHVDTSVGRCLVGVESCASIMENSDRVKVILRIERNP